MIKSEVNTTTREVLDAEGNVIEQKKTTSESTVNIGRNNEPDYIKLYTKMWCEFNQIPDTYRNLFMELVARMSYCNSADLPHSQLVNTGKPWSDSIMQALGWKKAMYQRGLKELCVCGAIKQISRGVYQVNPSYAAKGEWKYNPRLERGGVEDLVATFNFKDGTVDTKITWAGRNDGSAEPAEQEMLNNLGVKKNHDLILRESKRAV